MLKHRDRIIISYKPGFQEVALRIAQKLKKYTRVYVVSRNSEKQCSVPCEYCIIVGGDGTFVRASHCMRGSALMLGVNPAPKTTEGFFTRISSTTLKKFEKFILGKYKIISLNRLEVKLNGKTLPELAINEVCFLSKHGFETARYTLQGEFQKSSGVLISTAAGSTAWISSAGGEKMPITSMQIQYKVREPYKGKLHSPKKLKGVLPEQAKIRIISKCSGLVVFDSRKPGYPVLYGDSIDVSSSRHKLRFIHEI